jgi:hypothetical protein
MQDVERWINHPIEVISSSKFRDVEEVFEHFKFMAGIHGAPCTREMKKVPRFEFEATNDLQIFGLTADETRRIDLFETNNYHLELEWNLYDAGITKQQCYQMVKAAGIELPVMYKIGFNNNNCIGCVKASSAVYWDRVRRFFPDVFSRRAIQSRKIGARLVRYKGKRVFLDQLPSLVLDEAPEEDIECGPVCVKSEDRLSTITLR